MERIDAHLVQFRLIERFGAVLTDRLQFVVVGQVRPAPEPTVGHVRIDLFLVDLYSSVLRFVDCHARRISALIFQHFLQDRQRFRLVFQLFDQRLDGLLLPFALLTGAFLGRR